MHSRTNKRRFPESPFDKAINLSDGNLFSENFRNTYNDIQKAFPPSPMSDVFNNPDCMIPNILNFDVGNTNWMGSAVPQSNFSYFEKEPIPNNHNRYPPPPAQKISPRVQPLTLPQNPSLKNDTPKNSERCGIKTLLSTRSKITYPFDKNESSPMSDSKNTINIPIIRTSEKNINQFDPKVTRTNIILGDKDEKQLYTEAEKQLQQYIEQEVLGVEENFIEPVVNVVNIESDPAFINIQQTIPVLPEQPTIEPKIESKIESKIEPIIEVKIESKIEPIIEPKIEPKIEPIIEPIIEVKYDTNEMTGSTIESIPYVLVDNSTVQPVLKMVEPVRPLITPKLMAEIKSSINYDYPTGKENISDIEIRMSKKVMPKKIDIKSHDNTIVNTSSNQEMNTNTEASKNLSEMQNSIKNAIVAEIPYTKPSIISMPVEPKVSEPKVSEPKSTSNDGFEWPDLTIKNINTTFKVIGDLNEGCKVKVVDDKCLAVDNAYIPSLIRYNSGQSREKTMSFLDHLLEESKRIAYALLSDIRISYVNNSGNNNIEINDKLSELRDMYSNFCIFLHKFDIMKNVYKADSKAYAAFGAIRNNFFTFRDSFFRELVLASITKNNV